MDSFTAENIENWMSFYYQNPQPNLIPVFIKSLSQKGFLKEETSQISIMFFLSFIFRDNSNKIADWLSQVLQNLTIVEKEVIIEAIFLSNTSEAQEYLNNLYQNSEPAIQDMINFFKDQVPPNLEEIPIDNSSILDILWSAFMATGSEKYVIRIISALSSKKSQDDPVKKMITSMAKWSLESNIKNHQKVKLICINQLKIQPQDVSSILKEIIP
ncbi:hypothetical protein RI030_05435 [Aphanizomenon flos-aquae NRERC-008]|jgi:hypothetical protein|uniref:Uncharacterized protein n=1 Tax=Aphanizomenon flos-aquae FACHB-1249 TaxID=2692889 RepID=A0ABR8IUW0_APHFL|nr:MULTISPECIES: hypothetical protein [Aphanizomenon]OBQ30957.1 MAG: hypothetical protein AN483_02280 [Aphanizomenon flos-aquae MDT14a]MBD2391568.1 hypothetical protein [Aphanizomenon flos-aquae FACHB-1171]MBD2559023.1 hypothetical protein [Aphanizomenon flos-aquae FACHB-1290]MBD2632902.1 hypothetical protein [Aphanizomenon sp. FACHB-1399]MBD2643366.1 hypothetical protein [Aphanizomenon sp. FACHB-1401]